MAARWTRLFCTPATDQDPAAWRLYDGTTYALLMGEWDTDIEALAVIDRRQYDVLVQAQWAIPYPPAEVERLFPVGTRVVHANPDLDWQGEVVPVTRGKNAGQAVRLEALGDAFVRVRWDDGETCWHGADALIPAARAHRLIPS